MKKTFLALALVSAVTVASAQDMMSKKGTPILPEAGDWSVGISVNPFFEYFGNMFNGTFGNSSPTWNFTNSDQVIVGKYMIDATTAYRGRVRIGFGSNSFDNIVDDNASTDPNATTTDSYSQSRMNITLGAGKQWSRGPGRLKGVYGAEAFISFGSSSETFDYGNAFTSSNPAPTSTVWNSDGSVQSANNEVNRVTERSQGSSFGFGLRGFLGAEYFFAPKMSVAGEFGWGLAMSSTGEGESTRQNWGTSDVVTTTTTTGGSSSFSLDTDNMDGQIILSFYF